MLKDKQILVTRPKQQAANLVKLIESQGGGVIKFPTLEIVPVVKTKHIESCLKNLNNYHWLIFISKNAVNFALALNNGRIENFLNLKIATVGKATAKALKEAGLQTNIVPETGFNTEALLAMNVFQEVKNQRFLIIRGVGGRETLAQTLIQRGAYVDYLEVYQRQKPKIDNTQIIRHLQKKQLSMITITSSEALQNLLAMLNEAKSLLLLLPLIVISDRIKQQAIQMGFKQVFVTDSPADSSVLETIITVCNGEDSG